jgi:thymidylate synthase
MINNLDKQYLELLQHILDNGNKKSDRTGTGTMSVFDYTIRFNMQEGFPLLTSKKMFTKGVIHEMIWFLKGDTNIKYLIDNDVHIWDGDAYKNYEKTQIDSNYNKEEFIEKIKNDDEFAIKWGELGPIYGKQWRKWFSPNCIVENENKDGTDCGEWTEKNIDQISELIEQLKTNPDSRRLLVSAWNVADIDSMVLPPCHYGFQCYTRELSLSERIEIGYKSVDPFEWDLLIGNGEEYDTLACNEHNIPTRALSLKWHQRSVDTFLGLPFNLASYGLLLELLAKEVNMISEDLIFSGGDVHLYLNHIEQAKEQITRETHKLPKLILKNNSIEELKYEDIEILGYESEGVLKGQLSN